MVYPDEWRICEQHNTKWLSFSGDWHKVQNITGKEWWYEESGSNLWRLMDYTQACAVYPVTMYFKTKKWSEN